MKTKIIQFLIIWAICFGVWSYGYHMGKKSGLTLILRQIIKGNEMPEIEDADIVVDLSGGRLACQEYRKRIATLQADNKRLRSALEKISKHHPDGNPIFTIEIAKEALKETP